MKEAGLEPAFAFRRGSTHKLKIQMEPLAT